VWLPEVLFVRDEKGKRGKLVSQRAMKEGKINQQQTPKNRVPWRRRVLSSVVERKEHRNPWFVEAWKK